MKKVIALGVAACALFSGCREGTEAESRLSIVGGTEADLADEVLKHTVALVDRNFQTFCTGTLITPLHILTAAHCIVDNEDVIYAVFASKVDGESVRAKDMRFVSKAIYHADYKKDLESSEALEQIESGERQGNDIALLQMAKPAPASFTPAYTVGKSIVPKAAVLKLAGFGLTRMDPVTAFRMKFPNFDPSKPQTRIASAQVCDIEPCPETDPSQPTEEDIEAFKKARASYVPDTGTLRVTQTVLIDKLAGNELINVPMAQSESAVCNGDSGGPAFVQITNPETKQITLILAGIASRGNCKDLSIHTDLSPYTDWVDLATNAAFADAQLSALAPSASSATKIWGLK